MTLPNNNLKLSNALTHFDYSTPGEMSTIASDYAYYKDDYQSNVPGLAYKMSDLFLLSKAYDFPNKDTSDSNTGFVNTDNPGTGVTGWTPWKTNRIPISGFSYVTRVDSRTSIHVAGDDDDFNGEWQNNWGLRLFYKQNADPTYNQNLSLGSESEFGPFGGVESGGEEIAANGNVPVGYVLTGFKYRLYSRADDDDNLGSWPVGFQFYLLGRPIQNYDFIDLLQGTYQRKTTDTSSAYVRSSLDYAYSYGSFADNREFVTGIRHTLERTYTNDDNISGNGKIVVSTRTNFGEGVILK